MASKHHRHEEQRNGQPVFKFAPLRKSIDSLQDLRALMQATNERYLAFLACLDTLNVEQQALAKIQVLASRQKRVVLPQSRRTLMSACKLRR
ncbi:hypothetical protein U5801_24945 [Lamprobacter modestohalophilus]|uniref:hypothetical protein n=1 Tax=Lamprobacter modestohalophilus TaxID=1064514 RepID=UPI002ADEE097|nr:hypothetical protein [Lamprobacter modestohalophilus]MEA1053030.1 hypothetical protein [Lamprobacter modestohalophilus]